MYLSRLLLNPSSRLVQRDLADCQALHRRLLLTFGPSSERAIGARSQFGLLYRVDERASGSPQVLVQSRQQPDWALLPKGYLVSAEGEVENPACKSIDDFYAALDEGMVLRFRLRANPTRRITDKNQSEELKWRGKRVDLRGEEQWLTWLARKGERHGFLPRESRMRGGMPDVQAIDQGKAQGWHGVGEGARRMTLASVLFNGILIVTDADRFRQALEEGIGSGKAYGFGLLSVARVG